MILEIVSWHDEVAIPVRFPWPRRENLPESLLLFPVPMALSKEMDLEDRQSDFDAERWDGLS
jgi:hypothetical protein